MRPSMYTIHSMFGSCSTQNPNCFSLMGRGVAWTATTEARSEDCGYRQEALLEHGLGAEGHPQSAQRCIKNVDFLVVFRVLRKIVRFRFLLRGTDRFCCVKWSCGQCVQESPSTVSRCRRRPFRGMTFYRCCIHGASQKIP